MNLWVDREDVETLCLYSLTEAIYDVATRGPHGQRKIPVNLPEDIDRMLCMCYDINRVRRYLKMPNIREFVSGLGMEVYGFGQDSRGIDGLSKVAFYPTSQRFTRHKTLVEFKNGLRLLWYEPEHRGGPHPEDGAFLVELDDFQQNPKARDVYEQFEALKRGDRIKMEEPAGHFQKIPTRKWNMLGLIKARLSPVHARQ